MHYVDKKTFQSIRLPKNTYVCYMKTKYIIKSLLIFSTAILLFISAYGQSLTSTHLPIVIIQTSIAIQDDEKILASLSIIDNGSGIINKPGDTPKFKGRIGIEYRGSSSQWFDKKPYSIETWDQNNEDIDTTLLGMPKESDWVLNAAYNDKTLMRDMFTYTLGGRIMEYAPRGRYCEMILNGNYQGIYIFGEKIKRNKERVPVDKIEETDVSGDKLTGGYIIKFDKETGGGELAWNSEYNSIAGLDKRPLILIEYPKKPNSFQYNYIKSHIDAMEDVIFSNQFDDPINGWRKYLDENALIDFIIMNEVAKNGDGYRLSTYMYKERDSDGGKIKMGPLWDFNLSFGNIDYCTGGSTTGLVITDFNKVCRDDYWIVHFWWSKFLNDKVFLENLKKRYTFHRSNMLSNEVVFGTMDSLSQLIKPATARNFQRWPILGTYVWPNFFVGQTYDEEINFLKTWTEKRLKYLDGLWLLEADTSQLNDAIIIKPNPSKNIVNIELKSFFSGDVNLFDMQGKLIYAPISKISDKQWELNIEALPIGTYILRFIDIDKTVNAVEIVKI